MTTTNKRLQRFSRARLEERPGLKLQSRDFEIIKTIHDRRLMTSTQIASIIEGSNQVILRRLQKLYHHGFLDRPSRQHYWLPDGSTHIVYGLGNNGADLLAEHYGIDRGKINWRTKNSEVGLTHIKHTLKIYNFRCCLELALKQKSHIQVVNWQQNSQDLKDQVVIHGERWPVLPDAFFTIEHNDDEMYFFLEADRSTMDNPRFLNRMTAYWHWWKEKGHERKYSIPHFRVLTITKSEERNDNLRATTKMADTQQIGSLMFWFACEKNYSLEHPEKLLKPIWQTPRDDSCHRLLE